MSTEPPVRSGRVMNWEIFNYERTISLIGFHDNITEVINLRGCELQALGDYNSKLFIFDIDF